MIKLDSIKLAVLLVELSQGRCLFMPVLVVMDYGCSESRLLMGSVWRNWGHQANGELGPVSG